MWYPPPPQPSWIWDSRVDLLNRSIWREKKRMLCFCVSHTHAIVKVLWCWILTSCVPFPLPVRWLLRRELWQRHAGRWEEEEKEKEGQEKREKQIRRPREKNKEKIWIQVQRRLLTQSFSTPTQLKMHNTTNSVLSPRLILYAIACAHHS